MAQEIDFDAITSALKNINQDHILLFYNELKEAQQNALLSDVCDLAFTKIPEWVENYVKNKDYLKVPEDFEPATSYPSRPKTSEQAEKYAKAVKLGENLIRDGKVAGFVVAGGQGTRLGFDGPKGNYPISPIKNKTLFQLFAEYLASTSDKYGVTIPWYVMTSPLNYESTMEIFENADFFGLGKENVFIFQQGTLPNFDFDGKILMADKNKIAKSPDGHGGSLKALYTSGTIADMKNRGIEYISYWQVDNPLIYLIDPLFIGLHVMDKAEMSSKALLKAEPLEKVGNFCLVDGKVTVIEYSNLPDEAAHRTNEDGTLVFELGSIAIHLISVSFVEKLNKGGDFSLPIHRAVKKIPHVDSNGNLIKPEKPNGIKLETFVFDALPMAEHSIILETLREEEFAPVKNATGVDSAEVTRQMMINRAASWLEEARVKVPRKDNGTPDCVLEISPAFALTPEDLKTKLDQIPPIKPGNEVYLG